LKGYKCNEYSTVFDQQEQSSEVRKRAKKYDILLKFREENLI
jgi:hypothetical protein